MVPARPSTSGNGEDHRHVGRIGLLLERDANRPGKNARSEFLPERRAQVTLGIGEHAAKAPARGTNPANLGQRNPGLPIRSP